MIFGAILFTILAVVANVGDVLTTQRGLALGAKESNPIAKWLFKVVGFYSAWWLKGLLVIALIFVYRNFSLEVYIVVCFVMAATGSFAMANNNGVIIRALRKLGLMKPKGAL